MAPQDTRKKGEGRKTKEMGESIVGLSDVWVTVVVQSACLAMHTVLEDNVYTKAAAASLSKYVLQNCGDWVEVLGGQHICSYHEIIPGLKNCCDFVPKAGGLLMPCDV
jgi:hypothetical protein